MTNAETANALLMDTLEERIDYLMSLIMQRDKDIAKLQADNRSFVEQMNDMTMKPNQEVSEWHQHPLYPETSRCCIVECTDNCFYVAHHSDIDGWLNATTYEQLSNVKSWAYLPIGKNKTYRDWETDRKSTRLNSSHEIPSRMPSSA